VCRIQSSGVFAGIVFLRRQYSSRMQAMRQYAFQLSLTYDLSGRINK